MVVAAVVVIVVVVEVSVGVGVVGAEVILVVDPAQKHWYVGLWGAQTQFEGLDKY